MLTKLSKRRFAEIYEMIEEVSIKYFDDIHEEVNPSSHPSMLSFYLPYAGPGKGT